MQSGKDLRGKKKVWGKGKKKAHTWSGESERFLAGDLLGVTYEFLVFRGKERRDEKAKKKKKKVGYPKVYSWRMIIQWSGVFTKGGGEKGWCK